MGVQKNVTTDSGVSSGDRFRQLSTAVAEMASREGLKIVPYYDPQLNHFRALSELEQKLVLEKLDTLVFICQQLQQQGERITSVKTLTWAFLKHFQCTAPSDLLTHMHDGDVVDAYGTTHKMLFAGLTFFQYFSYSLEDFFCKTWVDLFERVDDSIHAQLLELSNQVLSGDHSKVVPTTHIPKHFCQEKISAKKVKVRVEPQFFAPLYSKGFIIGYLCANRGAVLPPDAVDIDSESVETKNTKPENTKKFD